MKVLVTGGFGFIGAHLLRAFLKGGHKISVIDVEHACDLENLKARFTNKELANISYVAADVSSVEGLRRGVAVLTGNPVRSDSPLELSGFDAVVHLAGESIMGRWTPEKKARILQSRRMGTGNIASAIAAAAIRPKVLLVPSGTPYYGSRGDQIMTEDCPAGDGFLTEVSREWEAAAEPARQAGVRVVNFRMGVVLAADGGALAQVLPQFRQGLGGITGSGKQWMSWVAIDDVIGAIEFMLENDKLSGPVNLTAPNPVTNAQFTEALGRVLNCPTSHPVSAEVVKQAFGDMGEAVLLAGERVIPARLQASGYRFRHSNIEDGLRAILQ